MAMPSRIHGSRIVHSSICTSAPVRAARHAIMQITSNGYYFGRVKVDGVIVSGLQGAGAGAASYRFTNSDASKDHTVEFVIFDSMGAPATGDAAALASWALLGLCSLASALALGSRVSRKKSRS